MQLNLPILDQLKDCNTILVTGGGGGFDVFSGLPIYFTLRAMGKTVHLANYTFCDFDLTCYACDTTVLAKDLVIGTTGGVREALDYLPEAYLAQWFKETRGEDVTVWMLPDTGAVQLTAAYHVLVEHLKPDAILIIDGGVDSLMRGDEEGAGSLLEDTLSLIAVNSLDVPVKILASIGFGAETEEAVCHYNALENMAALVKEGAFLGSCALTPDMEAFQLFESACVYVWNQPNHRSSHISTRIIPAVRGEFGNYHMNPYYRFTQVFISPLMSLYWFFDAAAVLKRNLYADMLRNTHTKEQAFAVALMADGRPKITRARRAIPY